jgi:hypothetical protein
MFRWYEKAEVCYAYLSDVLSASEDPRKFSSQFSGSQWFTRGWTLQELLAPDYVDFFDQTWTWIGSKGSLDAVIRNITGISDLVNYRKASVAQKMSWASHRETTRIEDLSYCLLGLFGVQMPPLYGEGENAFVRLQREIMSTTDDDSILAWTPVDGGDEHGLLATSPRMFAGSSSVVRVVWDPNRPPHTMSSKGLCVHFKLVPRSDGNEGVMSERGFLAPLNCAFEKGPLRGNGTRVIALQMYHLVSENTNPWHRQDYLQIIDVDPGGWAEIDWTMLYVSQPSKEEDESMKNIAKFLRVMFSIDSLIGTGLEHKEYLASKWGARWESFVGFKRVSPGVDHRGAVFRVSADATLWAAISFERLAKNTHPFYEPHITLENYDQRVGIVVGVSKGRPWIDIVVLDKNDHIELILGATLSARVAADENMVVASEPTASARTLTIGLDRVSRKFLNGCLNGRLMVGGTSSELIVEVTFDPEGKLRWPVRTPLPSKQIKEFGMDSLLSYQNDDFDMDYALFPS